MPASDGSAPSIADRPLQTGLSQWLAELPLRLERLFEAERDQLPLWLPVAFGGGIAAWLALPDERAWTSFIFICAGLFAAALALGENTRLGRSVAIFCLAVLLGCGHIWWKAERAAAPRLAYARMVEFEARVEAVQPLPARETIRLLVKPSAPSNLPLRLRINVDEGKVGGATAGAVVRIRAWLMPPAPMAVPGAYDFSRVAWFQQIGGTGRALGEVEIVTPAKEQGLAARIASARQSLAAHIGSRLEGGEGGIATALATGDQGAISEEDAEAMRRSGLAHLLSVSGLHLTAMVGAVMLLTLKLLALSPTLALRWNLTLIAAGAGALAGIAYTLLTGSEVPTVRACIAAMLVLAGLALGREAFTLRLLAVGALFVLIFWPESLVGASFQLSFAAIAAIVALHEHPRIKALLSRRDEGIVGKTGRALVGLVLTGLAVEAALAPIALFHFHKAGFYGALANIVAIPLTTFVVMPLEALALLFDVAGLGFPFWWLAGKTLSLLLWLAHSTAAAPGAVALLPAMPLAAFGLMVGGGLWLCLWRTRWRVFGVVPITVGALWAVGTPAPDLVVTGDGRHLAMRTSSGGFALLRGRAGDYVRGMLSETSGYEGELPALEELPMASCSEDLCVADVVRNGRSWRVLATRTGHHLDLATMKRACADVDIVVSDRRLPGACVPRWLKADRALLARTGGLAINLAEPRIVTVSDRIGSHPWASFRPDRNPLRIMRASPGLAVSRAHRRQ